MAFSTASRSTLSQGNPHQNDEIKTRVRKIFQKTFYINVPPGHDFIAHTNLINWFHYPASISSWVNREMGRTAGRPWARSHSHADFTRQQVWRESVGHSLGHSDKVPRETLSKAPFTYSGRKRTALFPEQFAEWIKEGGHFADTNLFKKSHWSFGDLSLSSILLISYAASTLTLYWHCFTESWRQTTNLWETWELGYKILMRQRSEKLPSHAVHSIIYHKKN